MNSPLFSSTLLGLSIRVNPLCDDVQRMHPSRRFAELMPPEFVAELDAWMLKFFGTHSVAYNIGNDTVVVGPKAWRALQDQL